jgi:hypothetical protein
MTDPFTRFEDSRHASLEDWRWTIDRPLDSLSVHFRLRAETAVVGSDQANGFHTPSTLSHNTKGAEEKHEGAR